MRITRTCKFIAPVLAIMISTSAFSQMVVQAQQASLQPQINRDASGYSACGVRAVVVAMADKGNVDVYDFSMNLWANLPFGLLKAGKSQATLRDASQGRIPPDAVMPGPVKFWIAKESEGKSLVADKVIPAESKGYVLGNADLTQTMKTIAATISGERMQFAVRYKNEPVDVVVSFSHLMPEQESKPLMACFDGLVKRMTDSAKSKE